MLRSASAQGSGIWPTYHDVYIDSSSSAQPESIHCSPQTAVSCIAVKTLRLSKARANASDSPVFLHESSACEPALYQGNRPLASLV
jgi:hypothetical protein